MNGLNWSPEELADKLKNNPSLGIDGRILPTNLSNRLETKPGAKLSNKYHVAPKEDRTYNGKVYHSKKEAKYAASLDARKKAGEISFWLEQVNFPLPGGTSYRLDFMVFSPTNILTKKDELLVDDWGWQIDFVEVKGFKVRLGEIKRKQTEELYGIKINVV